MADALTAVIMNNDNTKNQKPNQTTKPDANAANQDPQQGRQPVKSPAQKGDSKQDIAGGGDRMPPSGAPSGSKGGGNAGAQVDADRADKVSQRDTGGGSDIDDADDSMAGASDDDRLDVSDRNGQPAVKTPPARK